MKNLKKHQTAIELLEAIEDYKKRVFNQDELNKKTDLVYQPTEWRKHYKEICLKVIERLEERYFKLMLELSVNDITDHVKDYLQNKHFVGSGLMFDIIKFHHLEIEVNYNVIIEDAELSNGDCQWYNDGSVEIIIDDYKVVDSDENDLTDSFKLDFNIKL